MTLNDRFNIRMLRPPLRGMHPRCTLVGTVRRAISGRSGGDCSGGDLWAISGRSGGDCSAGDLWAISQGQPRAIAL
ncbi:MAG: hypothetical protein AB4352_04125 [Hormoscilla sp.]